jgi:hypothetical protein
MLQKGKQMAKFKCKHTGCVYEWMDNETVENMRLHEEYEEIVVVVSPVPVPVAPSKPKKAKGEAA